MKARICLEEISLIHAHYAEESAMLNDCDFTIEGFNSSKKTLEISISSEIPIKLNCFLNHFQESVGTKRSSRNGSASTTIASSQ